MKIIAPFEKMFTPYVLIALNLAIIIGAEFVGGGTYFEQTGLIHAFAILFVVLIVARIFSDYAFSDHILRGFLKIQLGFFLFLGLIHVYEYLGLYIYMLNDEVVESSAVIAYLIWLIGNTLAIEWVFRIYRQSSAKLVSIFGTAIALLVSLIVTLHIFSQSIHEIPEWTHGVALSLLLASAVLSIWRLIQIKKIMPVFNDYARYAIPSIVLVAIAGLSEYAEAEGFFSTIGIPEIQNLYISHFIIYAALSILLIGFGKLKKPQGIYADM